MSSVRGTDNGVLSTGTTDFVEQCADGKERTRRRCHSARNDEKCLTSFLLDLRREKSLDTKVSSRGDFVSWKS